MSRGRLLIATAIIAATCGILLQRDRVVRFAWEYLRQPLPALALRPADSHLYAEIGGYYFSDAAYDLSRAKTFYSRAIRADSALPRVHYQLARIYFLTGDLQEAEAAADGEIALDSAFPKSYYMRGLIRGYRGDLVGAAEDFREYLRHDKRNWAAYNDLSWVHFQAGDYDKARQAAEMGLVFAGNNPWLLNSQGIALLNLDERERARKSFALALMYTKELTPEAWGAAYPGNDPAVYAAGLEAMKQSVRENLLRAQ